jgi:hypothetical protein
MSSTEIKGWSTFMLDLHIHLKGVSQAGGKA